MKKRQVTLEDGQMKDTGGEKMGKGNKHLCEWKKDEIKENINELKNIVRQPKYICLKCARVAKDSSYLHKPEELTD
jgi:hypothetical protein